MNENCILFDRRCSDCGECDKCDLDNNRLCNDCGRCIDEGSEFRSLDIVKFLKNKE